ncbi:MAG: hypothetical protein R3B06_09445 [Kofleriaceae bacterium]
MRLSELVSKMTPTTYSQIALFLFLGVFIAIAWRYRRRTPELTHAAALPLADDAIPAAPEAAHE